MWHTQKAMAALFDCSVANVNRHLKAIFESGELHEDSTIKDFLIVAAYGKYHFATAAPFFRGSMLPGHKPYPHAFRVIHQSEGRELPGMELAPFA